MSTQVLSFAVAFVAASLVSALTYWLAHHPSPKMLGVHILASLLTFCLLVLFFLSPLKANDVWPRLLFMMVAAGASGFQTWLERPLEGASSTTKRLFLRTLLTYLCTATLLFVFFVLLGILIRPFGNPAIPSWIIQSYFTTYRLYGYGAGWLLAPLSISFCRLLLQSTHLRPGVERPLRDDEVAS